MSMTMRTACASKPVAKAAAAFIGPTVCELEGPIPILKTCGLTKTSTALPYLYYLCGFVALS
ncbi:hypothetical protein [Neisseria meningitidis]|uniref:hypothetical protein n=1 Tax=Neisseria meningitidis TaxID=487 RepID=UPI0005EA37E3|nr:hypothetical protein [Neisseria meningitidis]CKK06185.1 Uncharacterised protein [Neisseria meningitidis]